MLLGRDSDSKQGSGSGLLSMMAARAGATEVVALEKEQHFHAICHLPGPPKNLFGIIIIGQYKAIINDFYDFSDFLLEVLGDIFQVFSAKSRVLGQIGRSGKVLGFISSNFGPDPTTGCLLQGLSLIHISEPTRPY